MGVSVSLLASGSRGNCAVVASSRTRILVDAGLSCRETFKRIRSLGERPDQISAILITHEHSDHVTGLQRLASKLNVPVFLTEPTCHAWNRAMRDEEGKIPELPKVEHFSSGRSFQIGDIAIQPFTIPHDAADPVGYAFRANGVKVAIVTDLGYMPELVKHHLREAQFVMLESNHDLDMLKVGPYPWYIKQRVMSRTGHLSNHVVSEFFADSEVFDGQARHLVLAHLSEQNNNPDLARLSAEEGLNRRPAEFAFRGELHIASQRVPLGPFEL